MDVYNHLLQRRKTTALARQKEDLDRAAREKDEDAYAEESKVNALSSLDYRRQKYRKDLVTESLKGVQALKTKHAQEVAALEAQHKAAALALKESIELRERELKEHFDKQGEALDVALNQAYTQRIEARQKEKNRLDARRLLEDNSMRNEVFRAFEQEVLSGPKSSLHTPPTSESSSEIFSHGSLPTDPVAIEESRVYKKEDNTAEDTSMLWSVEEAQTKAAPREPAPNKPAPTPKVAAPVRQPVKIQLAAPRRVSKRQKSVAGSSKLPTRPQVCVPMKTNFKLKSFSCGGATWHHSADIAVKLNIETRVFEIYCGKNSLSAMHPDWVMDGAPGQKSVYNTEQNTFELEREGRISIWLEFKFAAELTAFLVQYRAYFDRNVSITGS